MEEIIKSYLQEYKNRFSDSIKRNYEVELSEDEEKVVRQIHSKGFAIFENFFTIDQCNLIRDRIDYWVNNNPNIWIDSSKSDHRIFFLNLVESEVQSFFQDTTIIRILSSYEKTDNFQGFTLGNKVIFQPDNLGSGGGWHRDFVKRKQTKAILYLSDVSEENGPFQYLEGSHRFQDLVQLQRRFGFHYNQFRYTENDISRILESSSSTPSTITGRAGTLLLVDTRGIHRGMPIERGKRYALTNYYWFNSNIPKHIKKMNPFSNK